MKRLSLVLALGAALAPAAALAHHSGAMYDREKVVTVQGVVKSWQYSNPHTWLEVVGPGPDGPATVWGFESSGTLDLARAGIKRNSFVSGEKVSVRTHPLRDGRPGGSLMDVTKADGTVLSRGPG